MKTIVSIGLILLAILVYGVWNLYNNVRCPATAGHNVSMEEYEIAKAEECEAIRRVAYWTQQYDSLSIILKIKKTDPEIRRRLRDCVASLERAQLDLIGPRPHLIRSFNPEAPVGSRIRLQRDILTTCKELQ